MQTGVKIANVVVSVPYKGAGNVIRQNEVSFDVYKAEDAYRAVPLLAEDERRAANLPPELNFSIVNGKPESSRKIDGNFHVIEDITARLQQTSVLDAFTAG